MFIVQYDGHSSLVYGADWCAFSTKDNIEIETQTESVVHEDSSTLDSATFVVSVSFYDNAVHSTRIW